MRYITGSGLRLVHMRGENPVNAWQRVARAVNEMLDAARADALREAAAVCRERSGYFNARAENQAPGSYPQSLAYALRDGAKGCEYSILNLLNTEGHNDR